MNFLGRSNKSQLTKFPICHIHILNRVNCSSQERFIFAELCYLKTKANQEEKQSISQHICRIGIPVLVLNGHSFGPREMTHIWPDILFQYRKSLCHNPTFTLKTGQRSHNDYLIILLLMLHYLRTKYNSNFKNVKHYLDNHGLLSTMSKTEKVTNTQKNLQLFQHWYYSYDQRSFL